MKRTYQGWLLAGLATLGQPGVNMAFGQASAQSSAPVVTPAAQSVGPAPGYGGSPSTYPSGGASTYPRGYQFPPAVARPSPQSYLSAPGPAASRIPYPRSAASFPRGNQAMQPPAASSQAGTGGYGGVTAPGTTPSDQAGALGTAAGGAPSGTSETGAGTGAPPSGAGGAEGAGSPSGGTVPGAAGAGGTPEAGGAGAPGAGTEPGATEGGLAPSTGLESTGTGGLLSGLGGDIGAGAQASFTPNMIGDLSPFYSQPAVSPPGPRGLHGAALLYPTVRNFKASENQSPRPQDRIFFDFNYYTNLNSSINTVEKTQVERMRAYTYMWGFEKTFDDGNGSIGMRLPLNTLTADSLNNAVSTPTSTALGNLDIFGKYILKQNMQTGSLITAGFQITPSTATSRFAGAPYVTSLNTTYFQPFIAYLWRHDRFYLQGFSGFDFPANNADVTLMYNDIGMGYFVYRNDDRSRFITAIAPTFEVHVDSPFNHRNPYNTFDPAASPYVCNLTYGLNVMFYGRSMLTAALVTPVTSPKPFDAEFALLFNVFFGRTVRGPQPITPPIIQ